MIEKLMYFGILAASLFSASVAQQTRDSCSTTEFWCQDVGCISSDLVCNDLKDCADGSDELGCDKLFLFLSLLQPKWPQAGCRQNEWACWDGSCVVSRFRCDGVVDCKDGSDENFETCRNRTQPLAVVSSLSEIYMENNDDGREGKEINNKGNLLEARPNITVYTQLLNSCKLPEYPAFGTYKTNIPNAKPKEAYDSVTIEVTCQKGFEVDRPSGVAKCQNGEWLTQIPKCTPISQCYLPTDSAIEYRCIVSGPVIGTRNCTEFESIGTVVTHKCRPNYYSPTPAMYMRCNANGQWDNVARCIPECGTVTSEGMELIIDGTSAKKAEVPWHAGIYTKTQNPYKQICGGTLISSKIIISAAHCFWSGLEGQLPADEFAVAVGKLFRPWADKMDDAQQSDIMELHVPEHFQGSTSHFQSDIAVMKTKEYIEFNLYIRPVCLDFDINFERIQLRPGRKGKVAGWGLTSKTGQAAQLLQVIELPYINTGQCIEESPETFRAYISQDKICAGYKEDGKALCKGDSGGGLAFPATEKGTTRYYLRGIVSTSPTNDLDKCNAFAYTTFTDLQNHEHFVKRFWTADDVSRTRTSSGSGRSGGYVASAAKSSVLKCFVDKGAGPGASICTSVSDFLDDMPINTLCKLPPYPDHGNYTTNIPEAKTGGTYDYVVVNITCHQGYGVNGSSNVYCSNGRWSEKIPKCVSQCHLQLHPSIEYRCVVSGAYQGLRPCKEYEVTGTLVSPQCRTPHFYSIGDLPLMQCIDGSWDYVARCLPECGRVTPGSTEPMLGETRAATPIGLPWHAGIYKKTENQFTLVCGGSLISNSVVLSVAHCFWSDSESQLLPISDYAVAVGKLYRSWNDSRDDAQRSDVKAVNLPERYIGSAANFQADIAVVIVNRPFTYTLLIQPVCVEFDIYYDINELQPQISGKMAGWPTVEIGNMSHALKVIDVPYVRISECIFESSLEFRQYITADKICAGHTNGSESVCIGNSGSGLAFPISGNGKEQRYYIRGILSPPPSNRDCVTTNTFLTFTQILKHEQFIKQFLGDTDAEDDGQRSQKGKCKLPDNPAHGTYHVANTSDAKPEDAFDFVTINVTCEQGYEVDGLQTVYCYNGWWPEQLPTCVSQCLLKPDPSVEYRCLVSEPVDSYRICNEYEPSGTVASPQCRQPLYTSATTLSFMRCIEGNWDYIAKCQLRNINSGSSGGTSPGQH